MANPNIVNVTTIYGNTGVLAVSTVAANVVANPSSSGSIYKLNSLSVGNINTTAASVTVQLNRGGSNTTIAQNLPVAANSMQVILGKDTMIYLLENDAIQLSATANTCLTAIASWEQIS